VNAHPGVRRLFRPLFFRHFLVALALLLAHGTHTPSLAGVCAGPPPLEETDSDILLIKVEKVVDRGQPEKDKPIVFEASVLEALRGDKNKYPTKISVSRASRRVVGVCQKVEYSITHVPSSNEQYISAFTSTTGGVYAEADGVYPYTPEKLRQVKARIKQLSHATSNFAQEARRVDAIREKELATVFYRNCLAADLSTLARESTDVIVADTASFMTGVDTDIEFKVKQRLADSGRKEAIAVARPVYVAHGLYPSRYAELYKNGCILFLKGTPAAINFTPPKDYPKTFKEKWDNDRYIQQTFTYFPAAQKLWILPATPEMLNKVKQTLKASPAKVVAHQPNWQDPILQTLWKWPGTWKSKGYKTKPESWDWVLAQYEKAFGGTDTWTTRNALDNMLMSDKNRRDAKQIKARVQKIEDARMKRLTANGEMAYYGKEFTW